MPAGSVWRDVKCLLVLAVGTGLLVSCISTEPVRTDPLPGARAALEAGLDWLARHQSRIDGLWSCDHFDAFCEDSRCNGSGSAEHTLATTSLAALAYLGHDFQPDATERGEVLTRALVGISRLQDGQGFLRNPTAHGEKPLWGHCVGLLALAEALRRDPADPRGFRNTIRKGTEYLLSCQVPGKGWNFGAPGGCNTSATCWAVLALDACRKAGIAVPDQAFEGASAWMREVLEVRGGKATFGYDGKEGFVRGVPVFTTAQGVLCQALLGREEGVKAGALTLLDSRPEGRADLYCWYFQARALSRVGGKGWAGWRDEMGNVLLALEETQGCPTGSWDPDKDAWGVEGGGRVCCTALACLCLETALGEGSP